MRRWLLCAAAALSASAFTVHQHSTQEHCLDLQCPATAFEYGIRNLVSEESLRSDRCQSCEQCTSNGYSICLRMSDSRGRRGSQTEGCSCTHSVPANCHNEPSRQPPNITMTTFHICYLSALQAPPRAMAVNNKDSVIVTVEPFWTEPYWRELQMENLTLHYEFVVQKPEHCEGDLITTESDRVEHICKDSVKLEMDGSFDDHAIADDDDDEHEEGLNEYDDSLPPEVAFDRDVFDGAKLLKVHYTVQIRRPRQLVPEATDPFRDQTTLLDSEVLKFDLKPEIYGTPVPELPVAPTDDVLANSPTTKDEDEDTSDEHGVGTNFFEDDEKDEKDTKSEEEQEKEEEELEEKIKEIEASSTTTTTESTTTTEEVTTEAEEEETTKKEEEKEEETEKAISEEKDEEKSDDGNNKIDQSEEDKDEGTTTVSEESDSVTEEETEKDKSAEKEEDLTESSTEKTIEILGHKFTKWPLARLVFLICLCSFFLILSLYCCRKCCCKSEEKTANGYRYNNPNRNDLVCPPEKERLRQ